MGVSRESSQPTELFGSEPLLRALELLADPEEFSKRLAALAQAEHDARKVVESVGPIKDIKATREKADCALRDAEASRNTAAEAAGRVAEEARETASEIVGTAKTRADQLLADAASAAEDAERRLLKVTEREKDLDARANKLHEFEASLDKRRVDLDQVKKDLDVARKTVTAERARLATIADNLSKSVGI